MYFYFNNNISDDLGIVLSEIPVLPFVSEEIKQVEVGGMFGTLTKRTGKYKDLLITLECSLLDIENYYEVIRNVNNWVNFIEDNKLILSDNLDKCYKVKKVVLGDIKNELMLCKLRVKVLAQRFLLDQVQVV